MLSLLTTLAIAIAPVQPAPSDTPPAMPIAAERLPQLKSNEDIIAASLLADGSPVPRKLVLPQLSNGAEVMQYMLEHYPNDLRDRYDFEMPWAWMHINERGEPTEARIVRSSGKAAFDSLSLNALLRSRFKPALIDGRAVAIWVPMPVQASYKGLAERANREPAPLGDKPSFTPYTVKPQLLNRDEVSRALVRSYPSSLRDRRIGGQVLLWALIDRDGNITKTEVKTSSGYVELDKAGQEVARVMKFSPARNYNEIVTVWIQLPIIYKSQ